MDTKPDDKLSEQLKVIGRLLSFALPGCDVVLIAKPENQDNVFAIMNVDTEECVAIIIRFMIQAKSFEVKVDITNTTH